MQTLTLGSKLIGFHAQGRSIQEELTSLQYNVPFMAHKVDVHINALKLEREYYLVASENSELEEALKTTHSIRAYELFVLLFQNGNKRLALVPYNSMNSWHLSKALAFEAATKEVIKLWSSKEKEQYEFEKASSMSLTDFEPLTDEQWIELQDKLADEHIVASIDDAIRYGLLSEEHQSVVETVDTNLHLEEDNLDALVAELTSTNLDMDMGDNDPFEELFK
ncbi:hypothetical protein [Photobacterium sp. GB-36]|uniref:hypothetical protein n=1 Tax=Photobacterium sp. GB-36 TaxID=2022108 RepID=UPI000D15D512|nr:hypothetical protein [Photobacterium sp. GB-36]PSV43256.1 hypothetical protein C9J46_12415 [Photobacterium sp. GB-36]